MTSWARSRAASFASRCTVIDANSYLTLATADAAGRPWVTPVWFACDRYTDFFWLSRPATRQPAGLSPSARTGGRSCSGSACSTATPNRATPPCAAPELVAADPKSTADMIGGTFDAAAKLGLADRKPVRW